MKSPEGYSFGDWIMRSVGTFCNGAAQGLVDSYREVLTERGIGPSSSARVAKWLETGGLPYALEEYCRRYVALGVLYFLRNSKKHGLDVRGLPRGPRVFAVRAISGCILGAHLAAATTRFFSEDAFRKMFGGAREWVSKRDPGPRGAPHPPGSAPGLKPA